MLLIQQLYAVNLMFLSITLMNVIRNGAVTINEFKKLAQQREKYERSTNE
jgi:hypothetical protein